MFITGEYSEYLIRDEWRVRVGVTDESVRSCHPFDRRHVSRLRRSSYSSVKGNNKKRRPPAKTGQFRRKSSCLTPTNRTQNWFGPAIHWIDCAIHTLTLLSVNGTLKRTGGPGFEMVTIFYCVQLKHNSLCSSPLAGQ